MTGARAEDREGRDVLATVGAVLGAHGLGCRGGFDFPAGEAAPTLPGGAAAKAVLLIGNVGAGYWKHFSRWRAGSPRRVREPLDAWSRDVIGAAARAVDALAVSPSDRPFLPFQQWAMRAEGLRASPLGILIHPDFGLWHAYRGALLFGRAMGFAPMTEVEHACDCCVERPCLRACPVGAHGAEGFAYGNCLGWVRGAEGTACLAHGCWDRNACPVGTAYRYPTQVQAFHMAAFAAV